MADQSFANGGSETGALIRKQVTAAVDKQGRILLGAAHQPTTWAISIRAVHRAASLDSTPFHHSVVLQLSSIDSARLFVY